MQALRLPEAMTYTQGGREQTCEQTERAAATWHTVDHKAFYSYLVLVGN